MKNPTEEFDKLVQLEKDLLKRVFEYIFLTPEIAAQISTERRKQIIKLVRLEFPDKLVQRTQTDRQEIIIAILRLFNGRNATEIARRLQISRATVYRVLKQHGRRMPDGA